MSAEEGFSRQTHFNSGSFLLGLMARYFFLHSETKKFNSKANTCTLICSFIVSIFLSFTIKNFFLMQNWKLLGAYLKFHNGIFLSFFICRFVLTGNATICDRKFFRVAEKLFAVTFLVSLTITKFLISNSNVMVELALFKLVNISICMTL
jgi:hypothetical protein